MPLIFFIISIFLTSQAYCKLPEVNSFEELKICLKRFKLKEVTKYKTTIREIQLANIVMVKKDGVLLIDEKATNRNRKKNERKQRTKKIRERNSIVIGGNNDDLKYLITKLFSDYSDDPRSVELWFYLLDRAFDENVKTLVSSHINNILNEYPILPILNKNKKKKESKYLKSFIFELAFFQQIFRSENDSVRFLGIKTNLLKLKVLLRLFIIASKDMEAPLIDEFDANDTPDFLKPVILLVLSRSNGITGKDFLLDLALNNKKWAIFAWENLTRRKVFLPEEEIENALKSNKMTVRIGVMRYIGSLQLEKFASLIMAIESLPKTSDIETFNAWMALQDIFGKNAVPYDKSLWKNLADKATLESIKQTTKNDDDFGGDDDFSENYYDIDLSSHRIVFICDKSLSMKAGDRWQEMVSNLTKGIQNLESDYKFTTIFFSTSLDQFSKRLISVSKSSLKRFSKFMAKLHPEGDKTLTSRAIKAALKIRGANTAYLLSDGIPFGESPLKTLEELQNEDPYGTLTLHTISLEPKTMFQDQFLFLLAQLRWGKFVSVSGGKTKYNFTPLWESEKKNAKNK